MRRRFPTHAVAAVACIITCATATATARAEEPVIYTVKSGDTCAAIAAKRYGDARLVDIIHQANAGMGPAPHNLKVGSTLILPPNPTLLAGPDARLTHMRNKVEVRAPEPRPGKPNDPLFRGNRVGTKESSNADVMFRDETRVLLGENTLVVILGDANAAAARAEATLVTGSLRSRMSELSGGGAAKPAAAPTRIATDGGAVELKNGEAQVTVDDKKTTRVAVYKGLSSITAQKKKVDVVDGFGAKAEVGSAPTEPRPLPLAPDWIAATTTSISIITNKPAAKDLSFGFKEPGTVAGLPIAEWHVQLARDQDFVDILVDMNIPLSVRSIEAVGSGVGTYYAHVSAIDTDRFEGKWNSTSRASVVAVTSTPHATSPKAQVTINSPPEVECSIAGAAVANANALQVDLASAKIVQCSDAATGITGQLELAALPPEKIDAAPILPASPVRAPLSPKTRYELGASGRLGAIQATQGGAFGVGLDVDAALPAFPASTRLGALIGQGRLLLGAGGSVDRLIVANGSVTTSAGTSEDVVRARGNIWAGHLLVGYRWGKSDGDPLLSPYVTFGPEIAWAVTRVGEANQRVEGRAAELGAIANVGLGLRTSKYTVVYGEIGGRLVTEIGNPRGSTINASGGAISIGHRVSF